MNDCTWPELSPMEKQQKLMKVIQHKSKEVQSMKACHEKAVEEDILDFLIMLQSYQSKELK